MRAKQFLVKLTTLPTNRHSIKEILKDELQKEVTIIKEIVMEIGEILKLNGITYQNLCEYIKEMLGRKLECQMLMLEEKLKNNEPSNQFKLEKEQDKPKESKWKEMSRHKLNRKQAYNPETQKDQSWLFEKRIKLDKCQMRLMKENHSDDTNSIRNGKRFPLQRLRS